MTISVQNLFIMIFVSALVTYFLRSLAFIVFRGDRKMPASLDRLGKILPNAVMAVLVVYCLKDVSDDIYHIGLPKIIAVIVVALTYKWKHSTFSSILVGTALYMALLMVL